MAGKRKTKNKWALSCLHDKEAQTLLCSGFLNKKLVITDKPENLRLTRLCVSFGPLIEIAKDRHRKYMLFGGLPPKRKERPKAAEEPSVWLPRRGKKIMPSFSSVDQCRYQPGVNTIDTGEILTDFVSPLAGIFYSSVFSCCSKIHFYKEQRPLILPRWTEAEFLLVLVQ